MTELYLDAIEARLRAATPGPWSAEYSREQGNCVIPHDAQSTREAVCVTRLYNQAADAEFIARAPEDIAALVAAVRTLTAENERLRGKVERVEVALGTLTTWATSCFRRSYCEPLADPEGSDS